MTSIRLSKLEATGNDFIVSHDPVDEQLAARLCDRHFGVGADGLLVLGAGAADADCSMRLYNASGGVAEMSGNGARCLAWVAVRDGLGDGKQLTVATDAGLRVIELEMEPQGALTRAIVDMGPVTFEPARIPLSAPSAFDLEATFHGVTYHGDAAGMGNPHLVLFVDDPEDARVTQHGPRLEADDRFPNRTNVEFVAVADRGRLQMRVWERGVGETLSCGTGACAAAAVAHRRGLVDDDVTVVVRGGELQVGLGETVRLGGPVRHLFDVDWNRI